MSRLTKDMLEYSNRLGLLSQKDYLSLSDEEKLEKVRLKKLKLRLTDEIERLRLEQSPPRDEKNKRA